MFRRHKDGKIESLRSVPELGSLPAEDLERLASLADLVDIDEGTEIIEEERLGDAAFLVVTGEVKVIQHGEEIKRLGPGEFVGERSLLVNEPRSATVVAAEPTRVLVFGSGAFSEMLNTSRGLTRRLLKQLAARVTEPGSS